MEGKCFVHGSDAKHEVIIEIPAPATIIKSGILFRLDPPPLRRVRAFMCDDCYSQIETMPRALRLISTNSFHVNAE